MQLHELSLGISPSRPAARAAALPNAEAERVVMPKAISCIVSIARAALHYVRKPVNALRESTDTEASALRSS